MVRAFVKSIPFLFLTSFGWCAPTYQLVVVTTATTLSNFSSMGSTGNIQTLWNPKILPCMTTTFTIIEVTPPNQTGKNIIDAAIATGKAWLIVTQEVRSKLNTRTGEMETTVWTSTKATKLPIECYKVAKSSPGGQ